MSITTGIFDFLKQCPQLANLWSIGGKEEVGASVIFPQGASASMQLQEGLNVLDDYEAEKIPFLTVYEDFQINCYRFYDANDTSEPAFNSNVLAYDDVRAICDWIAEQDDLGNYPIIGEKVVSISCEPFVPQIKYVNQQENAAAYFITVRVRYLNRRRRKSVYVDNN